MKYCFTTLSIGEKYEQTTINLYKDLKEKTKFCNFHSTTMNPIYKDKDDFIKWNVLEPFPVKSEGGYFYFNMKCLSLKDIVEYEKTSDDPYEFIIFIDADWLVYEEFDEQKLLNLFEYMNNNDIDMIYERPGIVGNYKKPDNKCFFTEKLRKYDVYSHTKWDNAQVVNEQFCVYRNNWKFRFYTQRWEQFLWYSIKNNIGNFAEGFEMGVSALEAEMNMTSVVEVGELIRNIFYFYNGNNAKFIRY